MILISQILLRTHRILLVLGTAVLAIAASRLAVDLLSTGAWLALVGGGGLMYTSEVASDLETEARELARSTNTELPTTRSDVTARDGATLLVLGFAAAAVLILLAFAIGFD